MSSGILVDAVAAKESVLKKYRDLAQERSALAVAEHCNLKRCEQVVSAVAAQHAKRNLAAGEHYRFAKGPAEHKAKGASTVGHGVGTVEHDESVVFVSGDPQGVGHRSPVIRTQIRRIFGLPQTSAIYLGL